MDAKGKDEFSVAQGPWTTEGPADKGFNSTEFVSSYSKEAAAAASSRSARFIDGFVSLSGKLLEKFWTFAKQAVEIALSKFLVELCAMIIAGISAALLNRQNRSVDISTPGVFYNKAGTQPASPGAASSTQSNLWDNNRGSNGSPFDGGWNRQPAW